MRIASFLVSLLALGSSTAFAHEAAFNAVWVQPAAPAAAQTAIVPLGWTHGIAPGMDLVLELTPYYAGGPPNGCTFAPCREAVYGLITTAGVAFGHTIAATGGWEIGWFLGPKVLGAIARETGRAGRVSGEPPFVPGTATELGLGVDLGLEFHSRPLGLYGAMVIGWQASMLFNHAENDLGGAPPSAPVFLTREASNGNRYDTFRNGPNLNLLRIGFAF